MGETPLVSVCMPVYNGERFLKKTIDSIVMQTYGNLEIIIVDDASEDCSRSIIDSYQDKRITKIYFEENENICNAANTALRLAKGKYLAVIGHDDIWEKEKIERQLSYMEEHPDCGVCFTRCNIIDHNNEVINEKHSLFSRFEGIDNKDRYKQIEQLFFQGNFLCAPSAMIRTDILSQSVLYDYSLLQLQDYDLWLRILAKSEMYIINEKLINYRQILDTNSNLSSITEKTRNRDIHELYYIQEKFIYHLDDLCLKKAFGDDFVDKDANTDNELQCERMLLLKNCGNVYYLKRYMELLQNDECREILKEKYNMGLQDFYELNSKLIFLEPMVYEQIEFWQNQIKKYKALAEKQQALLRKQEQDIASMKERLR